MIVVRGSCESLIERRQADAASRHQRATDIDQKLFRHHLDDIFHRRAVVNYVDRHSGSDFPQPSAPMSWMQRLRRVFAIDISTCARCGGKVRVIAAITQPALITRILEHRAAVDAPGAGARAPPGASLH